VIVIVGQKLRAGLLTTGAAGRAGLYGSVASHGRSARHWAGLRSGSFSSEPLPLEVIKALLQAGFAQQPVYLGEFSAQPARLQRSGWRGSLKCGARPRRWRNTAASADENAKTNRPTPCRPLGFPTPNSFSSTRPRLCAAAVRRYRLVVSTTPLPTTHLYGMESIPTPQRRC